MLLKNQDFCKFSRVNSADSKRYWSRLMCFPRFTRVSNTRTSLSHIMLVRAAWFEG
jgi:hypothetical protein